MAWNCSEYSKNRRTKELKKEEKRKIKKVQKTQKADAKQFLVDTQMKEVEKKKLMNLECKTTVGCREELRKTKIFNKLRHGRF